MFKCTMEKISLFYEIPRCRVVTVFHSTVQMHSEIEKLNRQTDYRYAPVEFQPGVSDPDPTMVFPKMVDLGAIDNLVLHPELQKLVDASEARMRDSVHQLARLQGCVVVTDADPLYAHGTAQVPVNDSADQQPTSLQEHKHP